jgi:very-short-patch-repair endonuclease
MNLRRPNLYGNKTDLADMLHLQCKAMHLPANVEREVCLVEGRKFRSDLVWRAQRICVEVDGGDMMHGRHARAGGMASDCEKQNLLTLAGWRCYRFTGSQVKSGAAIDFLTKVLNAI